MCVCVCVGRIDNIEIASWYAQGPRCNRSCPVQLVSRRFGNADACSLMQELVSDAGPSLEVSAAW